MRKPLERSQLISLKDEKWSREMPESVLSGLRNKDDPFDKPTGIPGALNVAI